MQSDAAFPIGVAAETEAGGVDRAPLAPRAAVRPAPTERATGPQTTARYL